MGNKKSLVFTRDWLLLHSKTKQDPCSCLYFFVPSSPRDLGFLPCTATGRSPDLSSSLTAAPFKPSRISPVAYIKSSRNTVTRSRRTCTCFPFHLHGQTACRHHPLYLTYFAIIPHLSRKRKQFLK